MIASSRANLVRNGNMHREIAHPVRFWHRENIGMLTQTPSEDAGSRTRRADNENGSVSSLFHFSRSLFSVASGASRNFLRPILLNRDDQLQALPNSQRLLSDRPGICARDIDSPSRPRTLN